MIDIEDKMLYVILAGLILNITMGLVGSSTQIGKASIDDFMEKTTMLTKGEELKDKQVIAEQKDDLISKVVSGTQQLVEGIVNVILYVIYFGYMMFSNIVAAPGFLLSASTAQMRAIGFIVVIATGLIDFMLIRALYEFLVNKTRK